ncbi:MAG: ABC transporter substrate-binding protein [Oscillospiraceae bacterium]|nr:ABC transporter substrate-binding protein [Oscillospiraceae bacterium]
MKKHLSLFVALVLVLVMALPLFANAAALEEITILYPGEETDEMANFLNGAFAEKVAAELNMKVNFVWLSWSDYWDQKMLKFAANENIDLYWDGLTNLPGIVNRKEAQPLDELIAKVWPESMKEILPDSQLAGGLINGQTYGIPSAYTASSGMFQQVVVRQDLLEAVGMTEVTTPDDLREFALRVQTQFPEYKGPADVVFKALARYYGEEQIFSLSNDYMVVFGEESKTAYNFAETDVFKKVAQFGREMYLDGLYSDDLAIKYNERDSRMQTGLYLWMEASVGKDLEIIGSVKTADPVAELTSYLLAPEKPRYINATGGEVLCIPYSAKNPEGALKFLAWLWGSKENYMFCLYGEEGKDWELNENGRLVLLSNTAKGDGYFYEWMFRNFNYKVFSDGISDEYIDEYMHWDDEAIPSAMLGFAFNNTGFEAIETAVQESWKNMTPILYGYVDFDANYDKALAAMKTAGVDEYIAEFNRQLQEFMAK